MGKRITVLGGAGLIGTHLCLRLLDEGHEVFCVDTRDLSISPLLAEASGNERFRYVNHDIVNGFSIRCDEIYNLTAPTRMRYDRTLPVENLKINVLGSINALETARTEHARVVFASSGEVYGGCRTDTFAGVRTSPEYIRSEGKRAAEAMHRAYCAEHGVDARIARIFNTYGTGTSPDEQRVVMKMVVSALQNRDLLICGSGEQTRTFCWAGDMAEGLERLMRVAPSDGTKTIDLGGGHEVSIRALAEKIVALTGSRSRIIHTEARLDDPRRRMPDLSAAKRELHWTPATTLTEGLRRTAEYAEKQLSAMARKNMSWVEMH